MKNADIVPDAGMMLKYSWTRNNLLFRFSIEGENWLDQMVIMARKSFNPIQYRFKTPLIARVFYLFMFLINVRIKQKIGHDGRVSG